MKKFTSKQVFIIVFAVVAGIAFVETSSPLWTWIFWREFLLKLVLYGVVSEVAVIALAAWTGFLDDKDD